MSTSQSSTRVGILKALARRTRDAEARHLGVFLSPAATLCVKENVLSKTIRYETAIEWQIYRAQIDLERELERRHAIRKSAAIASS